MACEERRPAAQAELPKLVRVDKHVAQWGRSVVSVGRGRVSPPRVDYRRLPAGHVFETEVVVSDPEFRVARPGAIVTPKNAGSP
jgi:hypothetical protein